MGVDTPDIPPAPKKTRKNRPISKPSDTSTSKTVVQAAQESQARTETLAKAAEQAKGAPTLEALKVIMEEFDAGLLGDNARHMVFGRGNPQADIMVIGESPSRDDDEAALPFTGMAGALLDKMFAAIGLDDTQMYITTACNWRAPQDRDPTEPELAMCAPFLKRHIELVAPKLVVIVGSVALQALSGKPGITKARGRWLDLDVGGIIVPAMPIYSPSYLINQTSLKRDAWRDLLAIKGKMAELLETD